MLKYFRKKVAPPAISYIIGALWFRRHPKSRRLSIVIGVSASISWVVLPDPNEVGNVIATYNSNNIIADARHPINPMKTNLHNVRFITLVMAIAAALAAQPIRASIINNLVLTENSSTSLTATYNGSTSAVTVILLGPDAWGLDFVSGVSFSDTGTYWTEPDNSAEFNFVNAAGPDPGEPIYVYSDEAGTSGHPNGTTVPNLGTDPANGAPIYVTFNDNGDQLAVPDKGSTFGLLFLSFIALYVASRLRLLRFDQLLGN
jgi:hypothetical protein